MVKCTPVTITRALALMGLDYPLRMTGTLFPGYFSRTCTFCFLTDLLLSCIHLGAHLHMGPSIKYTTPFLANFSPPPPVTLCRPSRDPQKYFTHLGPPHF